MTAQSVTGIGPGSAQRTAITNMPKVLAAGTILTDGGGGCTIEFPVPLPHGTVFVTTPLFNISASTLASVGWAEDAEGIVNITIIGQANRSYFYIAVTNGMATVVS